MEQPNELTVIELFELAKAKTRRLTAKERRRVLAYIDEVGFKDAAGKRQELTNYELADFFSVDEKSIRLDRRKMLREYTSAITPEDAMVFVGTFMQGHDDLLRRTFRALQTMEQHNTIGTLTYAKFVQLASDLHKRRIGMLQEIGALPKELGNLNVNQEIWEAYIQDDGAGNATSGVKRVPVPALQAAQDEDDEFEQPEDGETLEAEILECGGEQS